MERLKLHNAIIPEGFVSWEQNGIVYISDGEKTEDGYNIFYQADGVWKRSEIQDDDDHDRIKNLIEEHDNRKSTNTKRYYNIAEIVGKAHEPAEEQITKCRFGFPNPEIDQLVRSILLKNKS